MSAGAVDAAAPGAGDGLRSVLALAAPQDLHPSAIGLIEALDRHGSVHASLKLMRWPVTVGRGLDCDLVLDDPHVAAQHVRLQASAPGCVAVHVLDTQNGARLGRRQYARGANFDWPAGQNLGLGRLHLRLRLVDAPLEPEQPLPATPWRALVLTSALLAAALALLLGQVWLRSAETQKFLQELPGLLSMALMAFIGWIGAWALASKLFSGRLQFWRHARIAGLAFVAAVVTEAVSNVVAFSLSWENLSRFGFLALLLVAAAGICAHLWVVAPTRRQGMAIGVTAALLVGVPTLLGTQWMRNQRLSNQLYMSLLFPPSWRIAQPVSPNQFLQEAAGIEQRLAERLKRGGDDDEDETEE